MKNELPMARPLPPPAKPHIARRHRGHAGNTVQHAIYWCTAAYMHVLAVRKIPRRYLLFNVTRGICRNESPLFHLPFRVQYVYTAGEARPVNAFFPKLYLAACPIDRNRNKFAHLTCPPSLSIFLEIKPQICLYFKYRLLVMHISKLINISNIS